MFTDCAARVVDYPKTTWTPQNVDLRRDFRLVLHRVTKLPLVLVHRCTLICSSLPRSHVSFDALHMKIDRENRCKFIVKKGCKACEMRQFWRNFVPKRKKIVGNCPVNGSRSSKIQSAKDLLSLKSGERSLWRASYRDLICWLRAALWVA